MKPVLVSKYVDLLNKAYSKYRDVKVIYRTADRETCNSKNYESSEQKSEIKNISHRKRTRRSKDAASVYKKNKGLMSAVHFNPNEDLIILEALKKEKDVGVVIRKLKIELKRSYRSIQHRIVKLQSGSSRRETKTFSLAEDLKIIDNAVESIRYGQTLSRCEIAKVDDLGKDQTYFKTTYLFTILTLFRSGGYQIYTCLLFSLYLWHGYCSESEQTYRNRVKIKQIHLFLELDNGMKIVALKHLRPVTSIA